MALSSVRSNRRPCWRKSSSAWQRRQTGEAASPLAHALKPWRPADCRQVTGGPEMATILVVDDRPVNRAVLVSLLGYQGHRMLEAGDGSEALTIAQAEHPALI